MISFQMVIVNCEWIKAYLQLRLIFRYSLYHLLL